MTKSFQFDDPVVLIGGASIDPALFGVCTGMPIIAADGGANHLRHKNLVPALVLGDLDSLQDKRYWQSITRVLEIDEQDTTDFEKCLYTVEAPYYVALGFSGERLDHTLATLHVMQKYADKNVILAAEEDVVVVCSDPISFNVPVNTRVSIYPLSEVRFVSSTGLKFELNGLIMEPGRFIGTSNTSSESQVTIVPEDHSGEFALLLPIDQLQSIIEVLES